MASGTPSCRLPPPLRGLKKRGVDLALRNAYFDYYIDACEAGTLFSKRKVLSESDEKIYFPIQLQNLARGPRPAEHIDFAVSQRVFNHFLIPSGGDTRHHNDARHDGVKV